MPKLLKHGVRKTSTKHSTTRLLRDDFREVARLAVDLKKTEGEVLRELVHEALYGRRLRRAGRDEITAPVRDAQRDVVREELAEMKRQVKELLDLGEHMFRMIEDLEHELVPLMFELVFDAWTDGRLARDVVLEKLYFPALPDAERAGRDDDALHAALLARADAASRRKVAELREKVVANPFLARRFATS